MISQHFTRSFLGRLQNILSGELQDWAIVAKLTRDFYDAAADQGEVVIFSDNVILLRKTYDGSGLSAND